jgi:hypothetical protein
MVTLLKPNHLKEIASDAEMARMREEEEERKKADRRKAELREAFMSREIHPKAIERINEAVRIAAQNGHNQIEVLTFPSSYCSDGGRRINIGDPEWPATLEGFAKKAYEFYEKELRPLGYKISAEIISFPGGMPGEAALYLKW